MTFLGATNINKYYVFLKSVKIDDLHYLLYLLLYYYALFVGKLKYGKNGK